MKEAAIQVAGYSGTPYVDLLKEESFFFLFFTDLAVQ